MNEAPGKRLRRGRLSADDIEAWRAVTRTLTPLKTASRPPEPPPSVPAQPLPPAAYPALAPTPPRVRPAPPGLQPIEEAIRRKLARGRLRADMTLDLHGMRQAEAHAALYAFLGRARGEGARVVRIVTGKGRGAAQDDLLGAPRGLLRRMVRHWLAAPDLRDYVIGFEESDPAHGGAGALHVRVRRLRATADRDPAR